MRRAAFALAVAAFLAASVSEARAPVWIRQSSGANPVAAIGLGKGASLTVTCIGGRDMGYRLDIRGPAGGLRAGRGQKITLEGRRKVRFRVDSVTLLPGGLARLSSFGGYRGSTGDQSGTLEAIESLATAKGPIVVGRDRFRIVAPSTGVAAAMAPLIKRCGDLKTMIKRAEGREGELG
ncbi:MAG: hypothetical protein Q8L23_17745 [Caulobacter sp.]|nr:hypothetical protein [Caulobacter sp.]